MNPEINKKYLITTDKWFVAPDGEYYKAVFGKVTAILNDEETLGIKTNRNSSNWYMQIGNMTIGGCQIEYAIRTDSVSMKRPVREIDFEGKNNINKHALTRIYKA
jgi:CYTH domain-containing protein